MNHEQAIQLLRNVLNFPGIKLLLSSADICMAEQAIRVLEKKETPPDK